MGGRVGLSWPFNLVPGKENDAFFCRRCRPSSGRAKGLGAGTGHPGLDVTCSRDLLLLVAEYVDLDILIRG